MSGAFNALLQAQSKKDPEFARNYSRELSRIRNIDRIINAIEDRRKQLGLSKKAVAEESGVSYVAVRRLLTSTGENANPHISTVMDLAESVGMRLIVETVEEESGSRKTVNS